MSSKYRRQQRAAIAKKEIEVIGKELHAKIGNADRSEEKRASVDLSVKQQAIISQHLHPSDIVVLQSMKPITRPLMDFYFNLLVTTRYSDSENICMVPPKVSERLFKMEDHEIGDALSGYNALERQFVLFGVHEILVAKTVCIRTLLLVFSRPEESVYVFTADKANAGQLSQRKINEFIEKLGSAINCDSFSVKMIKQSSKLGPEYNVDRLLTLLDPIARNVNSYDAVAGLEIPSDNEIKSFRVDFLKKLNAFHLNG